MKYKLHIPYVNRQDMLRDAISSVRPAFDSIHVWSNGTAPPEVDAEVHTLAPTSFTGVMNEMIRSSWDDDVMLWMHTDALALNGAAEKLMDQVQERNASEERWGALFTAYDALCCYNMRAVRSVGFYDPMFYAYTSDWDFYHRFVAAGWPLCNAFLYATDETMCGVMHRSGYANTIKADPVRKIAVDFRASTGFDQNYYRFKWGGLYEKETFFYPFNQNLTPREHTFQEYRVRMQREPTYVGRDRDKLLAAIALQWPLFMADDPDRKLLADYHIIEPYSFQRDENKMIVAMKKGLR